MSPHWERANRLSDQIIDVLNAELRKMKLAGRVDSLQLLVGQLLALSGTFKTMPVENQPPALVTLQAAVGTCLAEILAAKGLE